MSTICDDYGYWRDFVPAKPDPTITPTDTFAGQFLYRAATELETAKIALDRVTYASERANAFGATDEQLEGLKNAARDVECAIASVIEQLAKRAQDRAAADHRNDLRRSA